MATPSIPFTLLASGVAVGDPPPADWQPIQQRPLVIMVGVTGVGKSTTLGKLAQSGLRYTLLPNRRELTDPLIIAYLQAIDGAPIQPVTDRKVRFEYTRRYRQLFPGGMAHALGQLWLDRSQMEKVILYDGLRGADETGYAVAHYPQARFVVLHAPDVVRVQRLLGRHDAFDRVANTSALPVQAADLGTLGVPGAETLFTPAEAQKLLALVQHGEVTADDLRAKLQIVVEERRNYDPYAAIELLQRQAPERTLIIDTTQHRPEQVVRLIVESVEN
jgi:predicted ATPase